MALRFLIGPEEWGGNMQVLAVCHDVAAGLNSTKGLMGTGGAWGYTGLGVNQQRSIMKRRPSTGNDSLERLPALTVEKGAKIKPGVLILVISNERSIMIPRNCN